MSLEKVRDYFKQFGLDDKIMEFDVSSATVEMAAKALNCEPKRIAKTLSFKLGPQCILVLTSGDTRIDNTKYKARFGSRAKMLTAEKVLEKLGYEIGGVCPFGINDDIPVYLDISLKRFTTVFPGCGSSNSLIELTIAQLEQHTNYSGWVDVCGGYS